MSKYIKLEDVIKVLRDNTMPLDCWHMDRMRAISSLPTIEVSEDAISRENLIKSFLADCECESREEARAVTLKLDYMLELIDDAPSVIPQQKEGEWIPCSERLPKDIRPVLVTWKNTDPASYYQYIVGKHFIGTAHYHRGKWYWYSSVTEDLLAEYGKCDSEEFDEAIEAVAWMPLPTAYEGE